MESHSSMEQQFLKKLTEIIDANLHKEEFGVSELAAQLGMSRVTLNRKVKSIIKKSVSEFIRETRLKKAFELLQQHTGTVSEISFRVGFGSVAYFNRCFHKHYGFPPGEVLKGMHEPVEPKSNKKSFRAKLQSSKILYVLPVVFLLTTVAIVFFQNKQNNTVEKTIAVLPPKDIGPKDSPCIILEGFREDLESMLFSMSNLKVAASRTTTDTYRGSDKSLHTIAKELNVSYIVQISGQCIDNLNTIWVRLIEAKTDKPIWNMTYSRGLEDERIHEIQQEIALSVAANLNITLLPEELKTIEKKPTEIPAADASYRLGKNWLENYVITGNGDFLSLAKASFEKATRLDTAFADAYCQLAEIYISHLDELHPSYNECLDSGMLMADLALKYHTSLKHKTLRLQAEYYHKKGEYEKAISQFEKLWDNRNKDFSYYHEKVSFYVNSDNYYEIIRNSLLFLKLKPESLAPEKDFINLLSLTLSFTGFPDISEKYNKMLLKYHNDTTMYLLNKDKIHLRAGEFDQGIQLIQEMYLKHMLDEIVYLSRTWFYYYNRRDFKNAFKYAQELEQAYILQKNEVLQSALIGSLYQYFGYEEKVQGHIEGSREECQQLIEENIPFAQRRWVYGLLAGVYSIKGENKKALELLHYMAAKETMNCLVINQIEYMLMYDNLRNEPEYKAIIDEMKKKYLAEHDRVKKLLIREGIVEDSYQDISVLLPAPYTL